MSDVTQHIMVSFQRRHTIITSALVCLFCLFIEFAFLYGVVRHVTMLLILLMVFIAIVIAFLVGWFTAEPLAIYVYLREVYREQKPNNKLYTPLNVAENLYETTLDATTSPQQNIQKFAQQLKSHVLILGLPGAGKTMALRAAYQYPTLKQPWGAMWGRNKIPVYIPLKDYNVFLTKIYLATSASHNQNGNPSLPPYGKSMLAYLLEGSNLTGMSHLNPYLERLAKRGRVLFLYDGLNEIDSGYLDVVCAELLHTMQVNKNHVVMTCRELDYREQPALRQLVGQHYAEEILILPLKMDQIADFVERYVQADYQSTVQRKYSASEINDLIKSSRLSYNCTNPMMLVTLIKIIDEVGIDRDVEIGTKGRLLNKFVSQLVLRELKHSQWQMLSEGDVVMFLSQLACTARLRKLRNAIQLGRAGSTQRMMSMAEVADRLQVWLVDNAPSTIFMTGQLAQHMSQRPYTYAEIERFLDFAQSAALISISHNGVLSFRHELIAEYFTAAYLYKMDTHPQSSVPLSSELVADIGSWSEPVTIWAGMSDDPMSLAHRLANLGQSNTAQAYNALSLSLACAGVVWTPPHTRANQRVTVQLPDSVTSLLVSFVPNPESREKLAATIKRCADEGGIEVYRSLLPLIMETGIDDLLVSLDQRVVPELLFDYLRDAIDTSMPASQIARLVYILGRFGGVVIPRAVELSQPSPDRNIYLRVESIHILGRTASLQAVGPLISFLGDSENAIRAAAANALVHLGPGFALERVLEELKSFIPEETIGKIHWSALAVLRGFLEKRPLNPLQYQRILAALLAALASPYISSVQEEAQVILLQQAKAVKNTQDDRPQRVIELLIRSLADRDEVKVRHIIGMLKDIGKPATRLLLEELKDSKLDQIKAHIVEVIGEVRDPDALRPLLPLLADLSPLVQQQITIAFRNYAPASIPLLLNVVLFNQNQDAVKMAVTVLKEIGTPSVAPVIQALKPIRPGRTQLLVEILVHLRDTQAIRPLILLLRQSQNEPPLAAVVIAALGQFPDRQVIHPLLEVLASWDTPLYQEASKALSSLGEIACDDLLARLNVPQETITAVRVREVLVHMKPFLSKRLLAAFATCTEAQAQQLELVFLQKEDMAPFLVEHLLHPGQNTREHIFSILNRMGPEQVIPPLLEALKAPRKQALIARLLHKYPQSIPALVQLLSEPEQSDGAYNILVDFGTHVISSLAPALNAQNPQARKRAQDILIRLVQAQQEPQAQQKVLAMVVNLFAQLQARSYGWDSVLDVLTNQFPARSIPVLLQGLEDVAVRNGAGVALVRLVRNHEAYSDHALAQLLAALSIPERGEGAATALIKLDKEAVQPVSQLITHDNADVALKAQEILSKIGAAALPFVWETYRDQSKPKVMEASRKIFREMQTEEIKGTLVGMLTSEKRYDVEMALTLLLERMFDEAPLPGEAPHSAQEQKMLTALLQHVQTNGRKSTNLRVIALLLLQRKDVLINHLFPVLYDTNHQEWLTQVFLLLGIEGNEAKEALAWILNKPEANAPHLLRREVAGVMGMMGLEEGVEHYAKAISSNGIFPNTADRRTIPLDRERLEKLEISLRALGGLLAGGKWNVDTLQSLLQHSPEGSTERDLYSVLLGKQYSSYIKDLDKKLQVQQEKYESEMQAQQKSYESEKQELQKKINTLTRNLQIQKHHSDTLEQSNREVTQQRDQLTRQVEQLRQQPPAPTPYQGI